MRPTLAANPRPERGQQQRILVHEQPVLDRKTGAMVAVNQFYIQLDYESLGWQFGKVLRCRHALSLSRSLSLARARAHAAPAQAKVRR